MLKLIYQSEWTGYRFIFWDNAYCRYITTVNAFIDEVDDEDISVICEIK